MLLTLRPRSRLSMSRPKKTALGRRFFRERWLGQRSTSSRGGCTGVYPSYWRHIIRTRNYVYALGHFVTYFGNKKKCQRPYVYTFQQINKFFRRFFFKPTGWNTLSISRILRPYREDNCGHRAFWHGVGAVLGFIKRAIESKELRGGNALACFQSRLWNCPDKVIGRSCFL